MSNQPQSRNWIFTRFLTDDEKRNIADLAPTFFPPDIRVKYLKYQLEKSSTQRLHLQGVICFTSPRKLNTVKTIIGNNPHIEIAHDLKASISYCGKESTRQLGPFEFGTAPINQGKRSDLIDLWENIKSEKRVYDIITEDPKMARYEKQIKFMKFLSCEQKSDRTLTGINVLVFWGPTGLGKTYAATSFNPDDYYICEPPSTKGSKIWFDGYEGQKLLILDEFTSECCTIEYLKRLLDVYKLKVEFKGGHCWANWTTVIITSNYHPSDWYQAPMHIDQSAYLAPLERRIKEIRFFGELGKFRLQKFDKSFIDENWQELSLNNRKTPLLPDEPSIVSQLIDLTKDDEFIEESPSSLIDSSPTLTTFDLLEKTN